jgi:hypothetical protein
VVDYRDCRALYYRFLRSRLVSGNVS